MKKYLSILIAPLLVLTLSASAVGGGSDDPVISREYLENTYLPSLLSQLREDTGGELSGTYAGGLFKLSQVVAAYNMNRQAADTSYRQTSGSVRFKTGDIITLAAGSSIMPEKANSLGSESDGLVNVSEGTGVEQGDWLAQSSNYMASQDGAQIRVIALTTQLVITGSYSVSVSDSADYNSAADALYTLGLFKGDSSGYALERAANRTEGLVMFLRLLGEEQTALSYTGSHPFDDVPSWADRYVAYAYSKGYTKGVSDTRFGAANTLALRDYLTFIMRALEYSEQTDFSWQTAGEDAVRAGIINDAELLTINNEGFLRAHVAYLSYYALYSSKKTSGMMLMLSLEQSGAITSYNVAPSMLQLVGTRIS